MGTTLITSSIAQAHFACIDAFVSLLNAANSLQPDQHILRLQNAFDKYKLWAGNLGAMHSGQQWKKSLDYRLREASFYKIQVIRLLENLKSSLQRVISTTEHSSTSSGFTQQETPLTDEDSPWEVSSDSDDDRTGKQHESNFTKSASGSGEEENMAEKPHRESTAMDLVDFTLERLWKLPIRRPAPLDRMREKDAAETSYYQPFDISHVKNKFPGLDERVAVRLGKMISRRRQLLRYRKNHAGALENVHSFNRRRVVEAIADAEEVVHEAESSVATPTQNTHHTKATTLRLTTTEPLQLTPDNIFAPSVTATISSTGSQQDDSDSPIVIPKRPLGDDGAPREQFICPYCQTMQTIRTERTWRKHVLADLQPYVCTYSECALTDYIFRNQDEWYRHEAQVHRYHWFCNTSNHEPFEHAVDFIKHMDLLHSVIMSQGELHLLRHTFQHPKSTQVGICPLCSKETLKLKSHVARHLKQLSLFAIPQTDFMPLSDTEDNGGSDQAKNGNHASVPAMRHSLSESPSLLSNRKTEGETQSDSDSEPLQFEDAADSARTEGTSAVPDTSWDYVTPKFQEARNAHEKRESLHQAGSPHDDPSHSSMPALNFIQPTPPGSPPNSVGYVSTPTTPRDKNPSAAMNHVNESGKSADNAAGDTIFGPPEPHKEDIHVMNPYYQQRPICGASIGAWKGGEHLPPVSLGGIILVDGEPYGLTVHHMLDAPSDDESDEGEGSSKDDVEVTQAATTTGSQGISGNNPERNDSRIIVETDILEQTHLSQRDLESKNTPFPTSNSKAVPKHASSLEPPMIVISDPDTEDVAKKEDAGDIIGVAPGHGSDIIITQPAIDDVDEDFFPTAEDRDEDHLDSHEFGQIYASSGLRRWKRDGILHEVDWALIKIAPERLQLHNVVQGGRRFSNDSKPQEPPPLEPPVTRHGYKPEEDEYPEGVVPAGSLGGLHVHCFGRTTGLQGGIISNSMSPLRLYNRQDSSRSWSVAGGFGVGGDTGAWVIENGTGRVCGVVLAWSAKDHVCWIMPMQIILEDIQRNLGVETVCLPSRPAVSTPMSSSGPKNVGFMRDPVSAVSRPFNTEESWAAHHFETHAQKCAYCHNPYEVHRNHEQLCEIGHRLAQDVASFLYQRADGKIYSTVEEDDKIVQIEIPSGYVQVRGLLKAIERSLRHRDRIPFVSMDRTYYTETLERVENLKRETYERAKREGRFLK